MILVQSVLRETESGELGGMNNVYNKNRLFESSVVSYGQVHLHRSALVQPSHSKQGFAPMSYDGLRALEALPVPIT